MKNRLALRLLAPALLLLASASAAAQGVYDDWKQVQAPPPPELTRPAIDPGTTAFLVLDIARQTCSPQTRPRCVAMLPRVAKALAWARSKNMTVIYTLGAASKPDDIWPEAAMQGGEPLFVSGPDKFVNTDLEKTLRGKGIKTVITIGAASHGAVLHTAAGAAFRGFNVIVPVDLMAADSAYPEQYTAWHLVNAPQLASKVKLTRSDWLE